MAGLLYTHPGDDYLPSLVGSSPAAITSSSIALAGYDVETLANEDPMWPFKTADVSVEIDVDLGSAHPIGLVTLDHPNFDAALPLEVLVDDNPSFSSPQTYAFVMPAYQEDDFPTTPMLDWLAAGYGIPTARYLRVRTASANSVAIAIGGLHVCPGWRDLGVHFQADGNAIDDYDHPSQKNMTDAGAVSKYPQGYRVRKVRGNILDANEDDDERILRWNMAARGDVRPFLIQPFLPINEPWYVTFSESSLSRKTRYRVEETGLRIHDFVLSFTEVPRGLIPDPSAV